MLRTNKAARKLASGFEHMEKKRMITEDSLGAARQRIDKAEEAEANAAAMLAQAEDLALAAEAVGLASVSFSAAPARPEPKFWPDQSVCRWCAFWFYVVDEAPKRYKRKRRPASPAWFSGEVVSYDGWQTQLYAGSWVEAHSWKQKSRPRHCAQLGLKRGDCTVGPDGLYWWKRCSDTHDVKTSETIRGAHSWHAEADEVEELAVYLKDPTAMLAPSDKPKEKTDVPVVPATEETMKLLQQAYDNMNVAVVHVKKNAREVGQRSEDYDDFLSDVLTFSMKVSKAITDLDGLLCSASRVSTQWSATRCAATRRSLRLSGRRAQIAPRVWST
jgi:hypothetical protein